MQIRSLFFILLLFITIAPLPAADPHKPILVEVRNIWDAAPHNAFTDLIRFKGAWFCVFREGAAHVSNDGALRVIRSPDGRQWTSIALLKSPTADLRDPKITLTPDGQLMLTGAGALHQPAPSKHQTYAWFSANGQDWSQPKPIGEPNVWLWRVSWIGNQALGVGYETTGENFVRLYRSTDALKFDVLVPSLFTELQPNETSIIFLEDQTALCLLRRDGPNAPGLLGRSKPPYTDWQWLDTGKRIGGPHLIQLPSGQLLAATRLYDGGARTSLSWLDPLSGKLTECLKLPSNGDSSYPGLAWHQDRLWVSYYSSHEGKTSIYLAEVKFEPAPPRKPQP